MRIDIKLRLTKSLTRIEFRSCRMSFNRARRCSIAASGYITVVGSLFAVAMTIIITATTHWPFIAPRANVFPCFDSVYKKIKRMLNKHCAFYVGSWKYCICRVWSGGRKVRKSSTWLCILHWPKQKMERKCAQPNKSSTRDSVILNDNLAGNFVVS